MGQRLYECQMEGCGGAPHRESLDAPLFVRALCVTCRTWAEIEGLAAVTLFRPKKKPTPYDDGYSA